MTLVTQLSAAVVVGVTVVRHKRQAAPTDIG